MEFFLGHIGPYSDWIQTFTEYIKKCIGTVNLRIPSKYGKKLDSISLFSYQFYGIFQKSYYRRFLQKTTTQLTFICSKSTIEKLKKVWNMFKVNNKTPERYNISFSIFLWCVKKQTPNYKYLLGLIKRRSKVQEKKMSCEHASNSFERERENHFQKTINQWEFH